MKNRLVCFLSLAAVLIVCVAANAQCITGPCVLPTPDPVVALNTQSVGPSSKAAVRVSIAGGCGSGSVVGKTKNGSLVLTNAHVAGTRPGSRSVIRCVVNGVDREYTGILVEAAYSDRFLTDWAILSVDGLTEIEPVKLSTEKPGRSMYTKGSPRCVWPLFESALTVADIRDNSTLVRWRPNAIGGQSGSGCWDVDDDLQRAILTWSWGGLGAGQQTAEIYRQSKNKTVEGGIRTGGEVELSRTGAIVEVGYFAQQGLDDFDIWDDGSEQDPADPDDSADPTPGDKTSLSNGDRTRLMDAAKAIDSVLKLSN